MTKDFKRVPNIHRIDINDVFGPSFAEVGTENPEELQSPRTRLILHNYHIPSGILPSSLDAAHSIGCPVLFPSLSLAVQRESNDYLIQAAGFAGNLSDQYEESSVEWLCIKIYIHFANIALVLKQDPSQITHLSDQMIILGATCRELELAIMHRKTVEDRKKATDGLTYHNEGRKVRNEERKQEANLKMAHAQKLLDSLSSKDLTNSSLARLIYEKWHVGEETERPLQRPAKRTIENWLSGKKVSRALQRP